MARLFPDSKTFVDMPSKLPESKVIEAFENLPNHSWETVSAFVGEYFAPPGSDMQQHTPNDWRERPPILGVISDPQLREWVANLNGKWKSLIFRYKANVSCPECSSSAISLRFPYVIPGGRFREFYYWDSFWIVEGLLACGMTETVRGIILNFTDMIRQYGFIPNCSRIYCLNRTQPPMFPRIVNAYIERTRDFDFLTKIINYVEIEYEFWMRHRLIEIEVDGKRYHMNLYKPSSFHPRPESFAEDFLNAHRFPTEYQRNQYYDNVTAIAESGWDFSSRWYQNDEITSSDILRLVPVDLNSFMLKNEKIIHNFWALYLEGRFPEVLRENKAKFYWSRYANRKQGIQKIFWSPALLCWIDYDLATKKQSQKKSFFISNLLPLLDNNMHLEQFGAEIISKYSAFLFDYKGGIPISERSPDSQQWDYPNAWAPYEYFLLHFLTTNGSKDQAVAVAQRWINNCYCGFLKTNGFLFEKYDVNYYGKPGIGGEYIVQEGFGWTNGLILKAVEMFPSDLYLPPQLSQTCLPHLPKTIVTASECKASWSFITLICFLVTIGLFLAGWIVAKASARRRDTEPSIPIRQSHNPFEQGYPVSEL